MIQTLFIPGELPGLNEIINEARTHYAESSKQKKRNTSLGLVLFLKRLKPVKRADFQFTWLCRNRRRDPDNISAGGKYLFDGLRIAGIIQNDGWDQVRSIHHNFQVAIEPGVIITIVD